MLEYPPEWYENVRRGSPGCFKRNKSRPRQKVSPTAYLFERDMEKQGIIVRAVGVISVRQIKDIGLSNPFQIDGKMAFDYQSLSLAAFDLSKALDLLLVKNAG